MFKHEFTMSQDFTNESEQNLSNDNDNSSDSGKDGSSSYTEDAQQPLIYLDDDTLKLNQHIEERIRNLQKKMLTLKSALTEEKEAWNRQVEGMGQLKSYKQSDCDCESHISPCLTDSETDTSYCPELTISESVMDYEQKLSIYQRTLQAAQHEKRYQLRRQLAANAYKRRLLEVENMCNLELLRVKQSVQFLQPLQQLASEWDFRHSDSGDGSIKFSLDENIPDISISTSPSDILERKDEPNALNYPQVECIGSILYDEMTKLARTINQPTSASNKTKELLKVSEEYTSTMQQSQSAVWYGESNNASSTSTVASLP